MGIRCGQTGLPSVTGHHKNFLPTIMDVPSDGRQGDGRESAIEKMGQKLTQKALITPNDLQ